jgi:hypothetical protein
LADVADDRGRVLADGLAALAELERQLSQTRASLRLAEESVVRQKELLETATGMIEEARRWARTLWDDTPASAEPVVLNEPEFAPAWLTATGPRHTSAPARTPAPRPHTAHELRLAALDRLLAAVEEEWGPITEEDMAAAPERLRRRVPPPA